MKRHFSVEFSLQRYNSKLEIQMKWLTVRGNTNYLHWLRRKCSQSAGQTARHKISLQKSIILLAIDKKKTKKKEKDGKCFVQSITESAECRGDIFTVEAQSCLADYPIIPSEDVWSMGVRCDHSACRCQSQSLHTPTLPSACEVTPGDCQAFCRMVWKLAGKDKFLRIVRETEKE